MNIRDSLGFSAPYWTINREERNYAALLYNALLMPGNLERFLSRAGCPFPVIDEEVAAYFEYAYLRDLWDASNATNEKKRELITDLLGTADVTSLGSASILDWNQHFGVGTPVASSTIVQSPSRWSLQKFHESISDNDDFLATCKFKWSFNIKPDLVIHTTNSHAVVIEAKYVSGEGFYPASPAERAIFKARGLPRVGQTALQDNMFRDLLGVDAVYLFVVNDIKAKSDTHRTMLWSEAFGAMDLESVPKFVSDWLTQLAVGPATLEVS